MIYQHHKGDKVKFVGCTKEQIDWGNNDDPKNLLHEKEIYIIDDIDVHKSHTKLTLQGIKGSFNSVCFIPIDKPNYKNDKRSKHKK